MTARSDKEVVESQHTLAVIRVHFAQGHIARVGFVVDRATNCIADVTNLERQQHAVIAGGIGIDTDDREIADILGGIGDQSILTDHHDEQTASEIEVRQETAIDGLDRKAEVDFTQEPRQRLLIEMILVFVLGIVGQRLGSDCQLGLVDNGGLSTALGSPLAPEFNLVSGCLL